MRIGGKQNKRRSKIIGGVILSKPLKEFDVGSHHPLMKGLKSDDQTSCVSSNSSYTYVPGVLYSLYIMYMFNAKLRVGLKSATKIMTRVYTRN